MTDGAGAFARVIELELERVMIDAEAGNRIISAIKLNHGHAGRKFIEIIGRIGTAKLKEMYSTKLQKVLEQPDIQEKQAMAAAVLLLADEIASEYIFQDDSGLTLQELQPYLLSKAQTSVSERAYELIIEWVAANANRFESNTVIGPSYGFTVRPENNGVQFGTIDGDMVYIINSQFNELMFENGFNPRSVLSSFRKKGLIETSSEKNKVRNSVKKTINGARIHCVGLKINIDENQTFSPNGVFDL
jgi:hypothetical protein